MQELFRSGDLCLAKVRVGDLFPVTDADVEKFFEEYPTSRKMSRDAGLSDEHDRDFATLHGFVERDAVILKLAKLGLGFVSEDEVRAYAKATQNNVSHWPKPGSGRRFLMEPVVRADEKTGEIVTYVGPYPDTGSHGYEMGLWRHVGDGPFPLMSPHSIALRYSRLSSLVAKML